MPYFAQISTERPRDQQLYTCCRTMKYAILEITFWGPFYTNWTNAAPICALGYHVPLPDTCDKGPFSARSLKSKHIVVKLPRQTSITEQQLHSGKFSRTTI